MRSRNSRRSSPATLTTSALATIVVVAVATVPAGISSAGAADGSAAPETTVATAAAVPEPVERQFGSGDDAVTYWAPTQWIRGTDLALSGSGWLAEDPETQGSAIAVRYGTQLNPLSPEPPFVNAPFGEELFGAFDAADETGDWEGTVPFPTPDNSSLETALEVCDYQVVNLLTGSIGADRGYTDAIRGVPIPLAVVDDVSDVCAPAAPPVPVAVAGDDAGSVAVRWRPSANDGGSAVTGYIVTPYEGSTAGTPVELDGETFETTFGDLAPAATHTFSVIAVNEIGASPESARSAEITVG